MLKFAEANLSALIESTQDLIWSVDLNYRLISFNSAFQQNILNTYGVRLAEGMRFHEVLPPERAALWLGYYSRVFAEGPFRAEYTRIDGGIMELAFNPIVVDGKTTGISIFGKEITEQKAAEESRRFLAQVVESCEEAIITNAPSGEILTWNHAAEAIYGYTAGEMIGKPLSMIIAPELRELADRQLKELLKGAPLLETKGVALRKDGSRVHISVTTWPMRSSAGEVTAICTIIRDVSVQYEAEKAKALLVSVVESSNDAVHAVNLDGTVASWNRGAEALFGYTNEEIIGRSIAILAPPGRGHEVPSFMRIVARGEHVAPFDTYLRNKDGRNIDVSLSISPIRNSAGEVVGASAIARDITQRKQIERELEEAEKNRSLLASVVESSGDLINTINLDGTITSWNPGAERLTGYTSEEVVGKNAATLVPPGHEYDVHQNLKTIQGGSSIDSVDAVFQRKDGSGIDVSLNLSPIRNSAGEVVGASAIARDISQRKQIEMQLRDSLDSLQESQAIGGLGSYVLDIGSGVWTSSNVLDEVFGIGKEYEHTVAGWTALIHPDDRAMMAVYFAEEVAGKGLNFNKEYRIVRLADQDVRWVHGLGRLEFDGKGHPVKMRGVIKDITESKLSEKQLRDSEERYRATFDQAAVGIVHASFEGIILRGNERFAAIAGYSPEEIPGLSVRQITAPEDRAATATVMQRVARGFGAEAVEKRYIRKDGSLFWARTTVSVQRDGQGRPIHFIVFIEDISQRKKAETQLRDSEERYRATFEQAAVGIVHASLEGRYLRCNARFAEIIGYPLEEIPSLSFQQITVPGDLESSLGLHRQLLEGAAEIPSLEKRYMRKDGSLVWARVTFSSQRDGEGHILYFIAIVEEIQARKEAEERLRVTTDALRNSEERYRTAFQMNHDSIDICRLEDGRFLEVNEAFVRCSGFTREEVIGHTAQEIGIWANPFDRQKMLDDLRRNQGRCNFETQYRTKNGDLRWGLLSVVAIELDGVPCILSITHDITEAKAAEECLTMAANELRLSEERYRTAFQTSLDAIAISRIEGGYIDCNQSFLDTLGYKREEVLGRNTLELGIWADVRDRKAVLEMVREGMSCRGLEVQFRKKNGELFWGEMSLSVMVIEGVPCILSITRDLTAAKAAEKTIRSLAFYDPLTGLPNRRHLMERLRQPLDAGAQNDRSQALLLIDLDHFKTLNDTLGHQTGDLMLQEAARRIVACTHEADTVCRLGGDEFVVLLEARGKVAEEAAAMAKDVGETMLAAIDEPCLLGEHECLSTASIGIAVFGDRQDSTDEILQQAEIALYQAKAAGRNTLRFFSPALQAAVTARATMEEDLRQGIKAKQFQLYYQPQMERGHLTGAEALIRWEHPRSGMVMPNDFIPLAEESRLILPLGDWVLEAACEQIAMWASRKETAHLSVAVNISALQFRQPEFVEHVLTTLSRTGANPGNLRLELTESMLVDNLEDIIAKMTELKSHGLRFSLDDFGTGYSSLTYLKRLPLDRLKIDRSFVHDMMVDATSGAIAQTILSLGRAMGISVIAEGVETEEQRGYLAALGCHSFQGYLFSRPLPLDKFEAFLRGFAENGSPG
jgi:diguanylate cyclase (GGDEF)-like protein/PAS domain S-box-containing protein